ncbi:MAG TPA: ribonuclease HII [Fimbriimonas sp.]|nr:ribonuclease HII [Fimbriimonas sp.]
MSRLLEYFPGCAGADEAGRGPLAGPVVAAAVMIPEGVRFEGLNDSKQLDRAKRDQLEVLIRDKCDFAICFIDAAEIDRINILQASLLAMKQALSMLSAPPSHVYIDGNRLPSGVTGTAVVKGDSKIAEIAAASILAKNERDRFMRLMAAEYPGYGFESHYGYPTPPHLAALQTLGPCAIHRKSYAPVQELLQPRLL